MLLVVKPLAGHVKGKAGMLGAGAALLDTRACHLAAAGQCLSEAALLPCCCWVQGHLREVLAPIT